METIDSKQSENFLRLVNLFVVTGKEVLADKFNSIHKCSDLPSVLLTWESYLRNLATPLTQSQLQLLYPSPGVYGDSRKWDVALICKLIREICSLTPPTTGWFCFPNDSEASFEADLTRLNCCRDRFYTTVTKMAVDDVSFAKLWSEVSSVLVRIASGISAALGSQWKKSIDKLQCFPVTAAGEENLRQLDIWYRYDLKECKELLLRSASHTAKLKRRFVEFNKSDEGLQSETSVFCFSQRCRI